MTIINSQISTTNVNPLPDQNGHNGDFLTTNGTDASWASINQVPATTGTSQGDILTIDANGDPAWQAGSGGLPSQTGNAGKFLVTDGTDANWGDTIYSLKIVNSSNSTNYTTLSSTGNLLIQEGTYWRRTQLITHNAPNEICFILATSQTGVGSAIGAPNSRIGRVYATKINNGADITVPTVGGTLALQIATMPTAGSTYEGTIYQFTGTTDSTYTNGHFYKCVSDGQTPATYSWEEVQLDADGTIPADRLASTTGLADGNYRLRLTMASGVPTLSWVAE